MNVAFDTDDPEFARGFEAGCLWRRVMENPDEPIVQQVHATNAEMVMRIAEADSRTFTAVAQDDTWIEVTLT